MMNVGLLDAFEWTLLCISELPVWISKFIILTSRETADQIDVVSERSKWTIVFLQFVTRLLSQSNDNCRETLNIHIVSCNVDTELRICPVSFYRAKHKHTSK